jgi:hypothetical protein
MHFSTSTSTIGVVAAALLAALILLCRAALPKPIHGIPYKKGSEKRLLGDAPDVSLNQSIVTYTCTI